MLHRWLRRRLGASVSATGAQADETACRASRPPTAIPRAPSLSSATREYANALTMGTFRRLGASDLTRLRDAMGAEIWAWQYALRLTGQAPWRAGSNQPEAVERTRASRQMLSDVGTWERALIELDAEADRARAYGTPAPAPLIVPTAVAAAIEARRRAVLERASRRSGRGEHGGEAPVPEPGFSPPRS